MAFDSIVYAGHSAVFYIGKELIVAIDPWLDNPLCPSNLKNPKKLDLIVLTHGHSDHASNAAVLAKETGATIAATWELAMIMGDEGVPSDQIQPMNKGGCISWKGLTISLVQALHSSSYDTPKGPRYAGEACGVVIKDGKNSIYHAGDTALFSDMKLIAELHKPTVALLPIGDRFTMGPKDAARAAAMLCAKTVIPIHHSTFEALSGTPEKFKAACADLETNVVVLKPGESHPL